MSDTEKLLYLAIKKGLEELYKRKIGEWNIQNEDGIYYLFDSNEYLISVKKIG